MKKILILGGLGNGSVIANAIVDAQMRGSKEWEFVGYLNDREIGEIQGYPVLGKVCEASDYAKKGYYFINTILRIDGQKERIDLFEKLSIPDESLATFIHPLSYVTPNVIREPGSVVMPYVAISSGAILKKGVLLNVSCTIGHDTILGEYTHVAAQACIGAYLKIGSGVHIGLNSTIRENLTTNLSQ
ncbi:MAG: hypothetical protein P9L91_01810 [Candidatus Zophobacter franzmannii]|nr:hypothetical protein [Candidatus Zophobacter franzmannii]